MSDSDFRKFKCKFCEKTLNYGFDDNDMLHCQICHRVWDGCAQCPCWSFSEELSNKKSDDKDVKK